MTITAWVLLTRNQLLGFLREPAAAVFNVAVPFFIILVQALAFGDEAAAADSSLRVVDVLPVSAAATYVMIIGIFGMGVGLASLAESRTLASYRLRPGGLPSILSAYGVVLAVLTVVGLVLSVLVLGISWGVAPPARPAVFAVGLLLCLTLFLAIGACLAAVSSSPRSAQGICSALFFPLLFLSGAVFPVEEFPEALRVASSVLPGRYVVDLLGYGWLADERLPVVALVYLGVGALVACAASVALFRRREDL